ncbi:tetratricopeptide repeat protein [Micromonospora polyrhachis]|uniref:Tetratricopeptide (TPR) repeat protein n=1 Tax=Micromonospora polyrhachis TaxID=1282883 RepID=A0A7W7WQE7_9ACTN|nr:tetratricopeptide repeat protein [Micromonospora polyrhachis]MBB4959945.1 tetratricopeptide (TPR) repeat protein [Micromonospora polyrhachis]
MTEGDSEAPLEDPTPVDRNPIFEQRIDAYDQSHVSVAARDVLNLYANAPAATERASRISVDPPFGRLDRPLRGRRHLVREIVPPLDGTPVTAPAVHVLHGLGGCGKSQVALEIARQARDAGLLVWWVPAVGPAQISAAMREIAGRLGASAAELDLVWSGKARSPMDMVWDLLDQSDQPWLLVFDNADDPALLAPVDGQVVNGNGWLRAPTNRHGSVIVTTREGNEETWGRWIVRHPVRTLSDDDAARVLLDFATPRAGSLAQARALGARLGGLPLALRGAGSYLKSASRGPALRGSTAIRTFDEYRVALDRRFANPFVPSVGPDLGEPLRLEELVRQAWELSLDLLAGRGMPYARQLLCLLACLAEAPIPYAALLAPDRLARSPLFPKLDDDRLPQVLDALTDLGLIDRAMVDDVDEPDFAHALTLHPLVRHITRNFPEVIEREPEYHLLIMDLLAGAAADLDPDEPECWHRWGVLAPQCGGPIIDYLATGNSRPRAPETTALTLTVARRTARYLLAVSLPRQAAAFLDSCLDNVRELDVDEFTMLALRHERARADLEQGRLPAAERQLRKVIAARERLLGPEHTDTLASRHKLARSIMEQGRWVEAEQELWVILAGEQRARGVDHPDTLVVRHSLSKTLLSQGRIEEAEEQLQAILRTRQEFGQPDHPETLAVRQSLARVLLARGKDLRAREELRNILEVAARTGQGHRSEILTIREILAHALLSEGRDTEAADELGRLADDRRRVLGDAHPDTRRTLDELAMLRAPAGTVSDPARGDEDP